MTTPTPQNTMQTAGVILQTCYKLSFATVDNVGHASLGDAPESVAFIVECWVRGTSSKDIACPWTSWLRRSMVLRPYIYALKRLVQKLEAICTKKNL